MAVVFFAAAWAAGVVEGGSVLSNASKNEGIVKLAIPSLFYGTAALPMGLVGASPGPALIMTLPFAPSSLSKSFDKNLERTQLAGIKPDASMTERETPESVSPTKTNENEPIMKRFDLIRKVREDNRKFLARKQLESSPRASNRYFFSCLDGRPLPTRLAEGMRRARVLLVGAGLVMSMLAFQDEMDGQESNEPPQHQGRDVQAIQSLVQGSDSVALRLVDHPDRLTSIAQWRNGAAILPITWSTTSTEHKSDGCWNLGTDTKEWNQMPMTSDWLNNKRLILEADVSLSPLSSYFSPYGDRRTYLSQARAVPRSMDRAMVVSNILGVVAREKRVLPALHDPVNVVIGSEFSPELSNPNVLYIRGPLVVAAEVALGIERMHRKHVATREENEVPTDDSTTSFGAFEFVGMKLRKGLSKIFSASKERKVVYVLSDQGIPDWLPQVPGWTRTALEEENEETDGVIFICGQNDEATCAMVCSTLSQYPNVPILALIEDEDCAFMLDSLVTELNKEAKVEILCVKTIHNHLFDRVRALLSDDKTLAEVQEEIDSMLTIEHLL